jgi:acylphosphatase
MFVLRAAERLRLAGWVRNLSDGSVELEAEGDDQALDALIAQVQLGPRGARVDDIMVEPRPPRGDEDGAFMVR